VSFLSSGSLLHLLRGAPLGGLRRRENTWLLNYDLFPPRQGWSPSVFVGEFSPTRLVSSVAHGPHLAAGF